MPIVCLNLFESGDKLQCFSSSSDGVIALIDVLFEPDFEVKLNEIVGTQSGGC